MHNNQQRKQSLKLKLYILFCYASRLPKWEKYTVTFYKTSNVPMYRKNKLLIN